ncbi:dihydrofolate reductase [Nitrosomonas sp. PY1]|uniref:dihydrofolate reductase n=1 Tax=Nitrosomonas sp. PY1 TaxID=1803906 RepID=UPI001FC86FE8|nr:dihydrofolate reductase [Nitrosomonas sp. PY1]GKS70135.1 dihydrofolate reductase [Nitrosomonas sp. PY1]
MKSPFLSLLVAMSKNRVIGKNNRLPWHLPEDLKHFKTLTMGHPIIMGRKTHESIGKVLPGRTNIIVTRQKNYTIPSAIVVDSIQSAFAAGFEKNSAENEAFVIGGEEIFRQTLAFSRRIYLTEIQKKFDGDTFFPELNSQEWHETERTIHFSEGIDQLEYHLITLDRKTPSSI